MSQNTRVISIRETWIDFFGNILWGFIGGGFIISLIYFLVGAIFCCTVILYPFGLQLLKLSAFSMCPFGKTVSGPYTPCTYPTTEARTIILYRESQEYIEIHQPSRGYRRRVRDWCSTDSIYCIGNVLWFPIGVFLFVAHISAAISCFFTIILIPFSFQHIKLAQFAIFPFVSWFSRSSLFLK